MNGYLSRLNPAERRFVIVVGLVFFFVINLFWIWPRFGDWSQHRNRLQKARTNFAKRQEMIQTEGRLKADIAKLASEGGYVPPDDQSIHFLRTIQVQAAQSGVQFRGATPRPSTSTNQFFMEQVQAVSTISGESNLVDFLYKLGSGNSMIRVREISIRPDQPRQQLDASITLVASYQKTSRPTSPGSTQGKAAPGAAARPSGGQSAPAPARAPAPRPAPGAPRTPTSPTSNSK